MFKRDWTTSLGLWTTSHSIVSTIGRTSVFNEGNNKHTLPSTISELGEVQFGDVS